MSTLRRLAGGYTPSDPHNGKRRAVSIGHAVWVSSVPVTRTAPGGTPTRSLRVLALSNLVRRSLGRVHALTVPHADLEHERARERACHRANTRWTAVGSVAESQLSHLMKVLNWNHSSYRDLDPDSKPASPHPVRPNPQLGPPRGFNIHCESHKRPEGGTDESCLAHGDATFRARILLVKRNMRAGHPPRSALKMQAYQSTARGAKE